MKVFIRTDNTDKTKRSILETELPESARQQFRDSPMVESVRVMNHQEDATYVEQKYEIQQSLDSDKPRA